MKKLLTYGGIALIALVIGFFAGMEYKAYEIRSIFQETAEELGGIEVNDETSLKETLEESDVIEMDIGSTVELATLNFTVDSAEEKDILTGGSFNEPAVARENAKFIVIDASVTNTTDSDMAWNTDGILLVDDQNRQFSHFEDVFFAVDNYLEQRKLIPDITETGVIVYEIPQDATHYSLMVGKAGTNMVYKINLK